MNNNKNYDDRQDVSQEGYVSKTVSSDKLMKFSKRAPYIYVYSPKTPYNKRKNKSFKGFNGLSPNQKEDIEVPVHKGITRKKSTS